MGDPPGKYRGYLRLDSSQHRSVLMTMRSLYTGLERAPPPELNSMNSAQYSTLMESQQKEKPRTNAAASHRTDETEEESDSAADDSSEVEVTNNHETTWHAANEEFNVPHTANYNMHGSAIQERGELSDEASYLDDDDIVSFPEAHQQMNSTIRLPMVAAVRSTSDASAPQETNPVTPMSSSQVEEFYHTESTPHTRRTNDLASFAADSSAEFMQSKTAHQNYGSQHFDDSVLTDELDMESTPAPQNNSAQPSDDSVLTDDLYRESTSTPAGNNRVFASDDSVLSDELYRESIPRAPSESTSHYRSSSWDDSILSNDFYRESVPPTRIQRMRSHGSSRDETVLSQDMYIESSPRLHSRHTSNRFPRAGAFGDLYADNMPRSSNRRSLRGSAAALNERLDDFTMELRDENRHDPATRRRHTIGARRRASTRTDAPSFIAGTASAKAQSAPLSLVGYGDDSTIASRDGLSWLHAGDNERDSPFPEANDEAAPRTEVSGLRRQGFPIGLAQGIKKIPLRFYVVNNSRSMNTPDALQVLFDCRVKNENSDDSSHHDYTSVIPTRRWAALQGSMTDHITLAGLVRIATVFRMVNDPGEYVAPQELSIGNLASFLYLNAELGDHDKEKIAEDVEQAIGGIHRSQPKGAQRPLALHLLDFRDRIRSVEDQLHRQGQQAAIILTTDGLPTDQVGVESVTALEEFNEALRSLQYLPIRIIIRLCTDDAKVVEYYSSLAKIPDLPLVVINDFLDEAKGVYTQNPWLNYAIPLHRYREMGCHRRVFDKLYKRQLNKDELVDFLYLLFGEQAMLNVPDVHKNWKRFCAFVSRMNSAEGKHWRAHTRKCEYWIDMDQLQQVYGKKQRRWWFFPRLFGRNRRRTGPASL